MAWYFITCEFPMRHKEILFVTRILSKKAVSKTRFVLQNMSNPFEPLLCIIFNTVCINASRFPCWSVELGWNTLVLQRYYKQWFNSPTIIVNGIFNLSKYSSTSRRITDPLTRIQCTFSIKFRVFPNLITSGSWIWLGVIAVTTYTGLLETNWVLVLVRL